MFYRWLFLSLLFHIAKCQYFNSNNNYNQQQSSTKPFDIYIGKQQNNQIPSIQPRVPNLDAIFELLINRTKESQNGRTLIENVKAEETTSKPDADLNIQMPVKDESDKYIMKSILDSILVQEKDNNQIDTMASDGNNQPAITNTDNKNSTTDLVKSKIYSLVKETNADLDSHMKAVDTVHKLFKGRNLYKIGYIVSYINRSRENMAALFKHVDKKKDNWDLMTVLNAYVQMKKTKEFLFDMLAILNFLLANNPQQTLPYYGLKLPTNKKKGISWSYYDDNI